MNKSIFFLISQSFPTQGGLVVYTGMNSNGEFFIGRKKYDAATGEEVNVVPIPEEEVTFFDKLTINSLTVNNTIDASTAISEFGQVIAGVTTVSQLTVNGAATASSFVGNGTIPVGGIIMWSGTTAPTGWALCNGSNGTPDLRDRFIVSSGNTYNIGDTGGANSVTLTEAQMPSHSHAASDRGHTHPEKSGIPNRGTSGGGGRDGCSEIDRTTGIGYADIVVSPSGEGQAHENRPPYYALAFIMRVS